MSDSSDTMALRERIVDALKTVHDPEIPVNIYDLGLIYEIDINDEREVCVQMTLTTPNCPVADLLPEQIRAKVASVEGVREAKVNLVWEPPWSPEKMSERAKLELEFRGIDNLSHVQGKAFTPMTVGRRKKH